MEERESKKHQCQSCDKVFNNLYILKRHENGHLPVKPFNCLTCNLGFTQKSSLLRHQLKQHQSNLKSSKLALKQLKVLQYKPKINKIADRSIDKVVLPQENEEIRNISNISLADTLNPLKKKTYKTVLQITKSNGITCMACSYCLKEFKRSYDLVRHLRTHTQEKPFDCNNCGKSFPTNTTLQLHLKTHMIVSDKPSKRIYHCQKCQQRFSSRRQLDIHSKNHSHKPKYICTTCTRTFLSKSACSAHHRNHHDEEFSSLRSLLIMKPIRLNSEEFLSKTSKTIESRFQCHVCGATFQRNWYLKQHEASHFGIKPFKCGTCQKNFSSKSSLNLHNKIHTNHKPYSCDICPNAKFSTNSQLLRHLIVHSFSRNFLCPYCDAKFKTSDTCKTHIMTHIWNLLDGNGRKCNKINEKNMKNNQEEKFQIEIEKSKPLQRTIKPTHPCSQCEKVFQKPSDLRRHTLTHTKERPFECMDCGKKFSLKSTLEQHRKTQEPNRPIFLCQVCGKTYSSDKALQVHLRIHRNLRPFVCEYCEKDFRTSGHRISHIRTNHKDLIL